MPTTTTTISTLHITFDLPLALDKVHQFRGAIAKLAGWENDVFHNHRKDGSVKYRYPLIQYRSTKELAALVGIEEGIEHLRKLLLQPTAAINLKGKKYDLSIVHIEEKAHALQLTAMPKLYHISDWLALNAGNEKKWLAARLWEDRKQLLEKMLVAHILAFCTAMQFQLESQLKVNLTNIDLIYKAQNLGVRHRAFTLSFEANIDLPAGVAIGKGVSHGYGVIYPSKILLG